MTKSLTERAYEVLKNEILTCSLRPGQQFHQSEVAEMFNFGKTPIREALQRLTQDGLVQPYPRYGFIVTPLTVEDMHEFFELRIILEVAAARIATERASDETLRSICKFADIEYEKKRKPIGDTDFLQSNIDFHCSIALAAGNSKLATSIKTVLEDCTRVFHLTLDFQDEEMLLEHILVAKALQERNTDQVELLTRTQIGRTKDTILDKLLGHSNSGQGLVIDIKSGVA